MSVDSCWQPLAAGNSWQQNEGQLYELKVHFSNEIFVFPNFDRSLPQANLHERHHFCAMYTIKDSPGKGKGLVANNIVRRGTELLSEKSAFFLTFDSVMSRGIHAVLSEKIHALGPSAKAKFVALGDHLPDAPEILKWVYIFGENATCAKNGDERLIFLDCCRLNHACDANSQHFVNDDLRTMTVRALKDIQPGEEITICYLTELGNLAQRQASLIANFGFICTCHLCSLDPAASRASDVRLEAIARFKKLFIEGGDRAIVETPLLMLRHLDELVQLHSCGLAGIADRHEAYLNAFKVTLSNNDQARAKIFLHKALVDVRTAWGQDHIDYIFGRDAYNKLKRRVCLHPLSTQWASDIDDVPKLDDKDFDDWLWRRKKRNVKSKKKRCEKEKKVGEGQVDAQGSEDVSSQPT